VRSHKGRELKLDCPVSQFQNILVYMKLPIAEHAKSLLIEAGLSGWTLEAVALRAGCAKGLVAYHHRTRSALLGAVAAQLRGDRLRRRGAALEGTGSAAIDALWTVIVDEHRSGESAAWFALLASRDPEIRLGQHAPADEATLLGRRMVTALSLETDAVAVGHTTIAALDGFAAALLQGGLVEDVRDAYHRFWLGLLG